MSSNAPNFRNDRDDDNSNDEGEYRRPRQDREKPRSVNVKGKLIKTQGDGEAVVFGFRFMNLFSFNIIVNIPFQGDTEAPVFIRMGNPQPEDFIEPVPERPYMPNRG